MTTSIDHDSEADEASLEERLRVELERSERSKRPDDEPDAALDAIVKRVIGAAIEVHRHLGPGFLESVYETAMCVELDHRGIVYERQVRTPIVYKEAVVGEHVVDLLIEGSLVVELKTVAALAPVHLAQVLSYLKARGARLALVFNFLVPRLGEGGIKRVIRSAKDR